jgi:hypothetical protein
LFLYLEFLRVVERRAIWRGEHSIGVLEPGVGDTATTSGVVVVCWV